MKCIPKYEQEYLACLERNAEDTRRLFSNEGRIERERMVVRAFLRCIGESFVDGEIRVGQREPVDIVFREATFQIKMMLGGRQPGVVWRDRQRLYRNAKGLNDPKHPVVRPWTPPIPISFADAVEAVARELAGYVSHYGGSAGCSTIDALVYVNLEERYLWPTEPELPAHVADELNAQGWRSVSMLFIPYGVVLTAGTNAPKFLRSRVGQVLNQWPGTDWFDAPSDMPA
jgi:hypothetical protein